MSFLEGMHVLYGQVRRSSATTGCPFQHFKHSLYNEDSPFSPRFDQNAQGEMSKTFLSKRYSYKDSDQTLLFVFPSNKTIFAYVFYSLLSLLWICLFMTGVYWQIFIIQSLQSIPLIFISLAFDGIMACFGLFILWQLFGQEGLKVDNQGICISYKLFNSEWFPKHYHPSHICNLRISVPKRTYASGLLAENSYWDKYRGFIVFDYKDESFYLGKGLGVEESEEVHRIIKNQFPQYC